MAQEPKKEEKTSFMFLRILRLLWPSIPTPSSPDARDARLSRLPPHDGTIFPMLRRLFTATSVISLLMCMATAAICVGTRMDLIQAEYRWDREGWEYVAFANVDGLYVNRSPHGSTLAETVIGLLYLVLIPAFAVAPVTFVVATVGERLRRGCVDAGHCTVCGYDLRASKERCPECGTSIPSQGEG